MKIGYFCESRADQAAMAVFTEGLLGEQPEPINMDLEGHGVTRVLQALDGVFRGVHYNSDAEGLIVVVDRDNTETHGPSHDEQAQGASNCRYCQIREIIARARNQLKSRQGRPDLKAAIGLAVPAIEAWYLVGTKEAVKESDYEPASKAKQPPRLRLKELVYGTSRPSLELETQRATENARRILGDQGRIENAFPMGFGLMAREIRSWVREGNVDRGS